MAEVSRSYGWKRDKRDPRDLRFRLRAPARVPAVYDPREIMPAIRDQANLGSCTGFGVRTNAAAIANRQGRTFEPSPLFVYYCERVIEGTVRQDSGAEIRDGFKALSHYGACAEKTWPYLVGKFAAKPPAAAYREALNHQAVIYSRVEQTQAALKTCLSSGQLVTFGFDVFSSFESDQVAKTGRVPLPNVKREELLGGHCVCLVGYNAAGAIAANSWGTDWGAKGYCYLPWSYLTNTDLASDFWTLQTIEG